MKFTDEQTTAILARGQNVLVSAGAGSGKTAVLSKRVETLLIEGVHLDEILVLTFTENAAANMKKKIKGLILSNPSLNGELKHLSKSDISTFDSFTNKLVHQYNQYLKLSKNIDYVDQSTMIIKKETYLDEIFESLYESQEPTFINLVNHFTFKSDVELKNFIISISNKLSSYPDKYRYLADYSERFLTPEYHKFVQDSYLNFLLNELKKIRLLGEQLSDTNGYRENCLALLDSFLSSYSLEDLTLKTQTQKKPVGRKLDEDEKVISDKFSKELRDFKTKICTNDDYNSKNCLIKREGSEAIINLVMELELKVDKFKQEHEVYEFDDIALLAIKVLKENPEVLERVKGQYKEIMIDEYQDTSDIQETLISLIENNNLFMVGDIKQSIYRFRHANPKIFAKKYQKYQTGEGGQLINLPDNFRSYKEVIEDINGLFISLMTPSIGGANYLKDHIIKVGREEHDKRNHYDLINYNIEDEERPELEAKFIALDILRRIKKDPSNLSFKDFTILIDRGTNFSTFYKVFLSYQIPLLVEQDENISQSNFAAVIKNLIVFLAKIKKHDEKHDFKHAFLSIGRSFLGQLTDEELYTYITEETIHNSALYKNGLLTLEESEGHSLSYLFERMVINFNLNELLLASNDYTSDRNRLLALEKMIEGYATLGFTLEEIESHLTTAFLDNHGNKVGFKSNLKDAVIITNIHKSKGLEYRYCYFAGLSSGFNQTEARNIYHFNFNSGIIMPDMGQKMRNNNQPYYLFYQEEKMEALSERIRMFYVALTRTQEKMIFIVPIDKVKSILSLEDAKCFLDFLSFAGALNNADITDIGLFEKNRTLSQTGHHFSHIKYEFKELNLPFVVQKNHKRVTKSVLRETATQSNYGTSLHELMECVDFASFKAEEIENLELRDIAEKFVTLLTPDFFEGSQIFHEYEFDDEELNLKGIIDLLVIKDSVVHIIDYKTSDISHPDYEEQLNLYGKVIKKKFNLEVKLYLYSLKQNILKNVPLIEDVLD